MAKPSDGGPAGPSKTESSGPANLGKSDTSLFILEKMDEWDKFDFRDDYLYCEFYEIFKEFTADQFRQASSSIRRQFQNFLRIRGVWVQKGPRISPADALANTLQEVEPTRWKEEEIRNCWQQGENFTSRLILSFLELLASNEGKDQRYWKFRWFSSIERHQRPEQLPPVQWPRVQQQQQEQSMQQQQRDQPSSQSTEQSTSPRFDETVQNQPAANQQNATATPPPTAASEILKPPVLSSDLPAVPSSATSLASQSASHQTSTSLGHLPTSTSNVQSYKSNSPQNMQPSHLPHIQSNRLFHVWPSESFSIVSTPPHTSQAASPLHTASSERKGMG